jgi:hypothetical protein
MKAVSSKRPSVHSVPKESCGPFLRGCGIGTKYPPSLRFSMMSFVMPSSSNRKWRVGSR